MLPFHQIADDARVWVYQCDRNFTDEEVHQLSIVLEKFADQWQAHGENLSAYASIFHKRFIVLAVDESKSGASGCSIDSSVHFLQEVEKQYAVKLFDRLTLAYKKGEQIFSANKKEIAELRESGDINDETLVFNNLVQNKADLQSHWLVPITKSWAAAVK